MKKDRRESWVITIEEYRNMAEAALERLEETRKALHSRDYEFAWEQYEEAYSNISVLNAWMHDTEDEFLTEVK